MMNIDRKSTRLNSSHLVISYAVFCLKKKKNKERAPPVVHGGAVRCVLEISCYVRGACQGKQPPGTSRMSRPHFGHLVFFFFNDTATTEIYTLSLHDALPI